MEEQNLTTTNSSDTLVVDNSVQITQSSKMKKYLLAGILMLMLIGLIALLFFIFTRDNNDNTNNNVTPSATPTTTVEVTPTQVAAMKYTTADYPKLEITYPEGWTVVENTNDKVVLEKGNYKIRYEFADPIEVFGAGYGECYLTEEVKYVKVSNELARLSEVKLAGSAAKKYDAYKYFLGRIYEVSNELEDTKKAFSAYTFDKPITSYNICAYDLDSGKFTDTNIPVSGDVDTSLKNKVSMVEIFLEINGSINSIVQKEADQIVLDTKF